MKLLICFLLLALNGFSQTKEKGFFIWVDGKLKVAVAPSQIRRANLEFIDAQRAYSQLDSTLIDVFNYQEANAFLGECVEKCDTQRELLKAVIVNRDSALVEKEIIIKGIAKKNIVLKTERFFLLVGVGILLALKLLR